MTNRIEHTTDAGQGNEQAAESQPGPNFSLTRLQLPFRRYFIYSSGIASMALGLTLIATFVALHYASGSGGLADAASASPGGGTQVDAAAEQELMRVQPYFDSVLEWTSGSSQAPEAGESAPRPQPPASPGPRVKPNTVLRDVNITFYDCANQGFCGHMYNGETVYEGAAACSWNLDLGTRFYILGDPTGRNYICKDRGLLTDTWVDIFWYHPESGYAWQSDVGRYGTIVVLSAP